MDKKSDSPLLIEDTEDESQDSESDGEDGEIYKCTRCTKTFKKIEKRDIHETGHDNDMKCPKCDKQLKRIFNYEKHVEKCEGKRMYPCHLCKKELTAHKGLLRHLKIHEKNKGKKKKKKKKKKKRKKFVLPEYDVAFEDLKYETEISSEEEILDFFGDGIIDTVEPKVEKEKIVEKDEPDFPEILTITLDSIKHESDPESDFEMGDDGGFQEEMDYESEEEIKGKIKIEIKNEIKEEVSEEILAEIKEDMKLQEKSEFRFFCSKCPRKFRTEDLKDIHETGHDTNNKCAKCGTQLKTIHNYEKHVDYCRKKFSYQFICFICGKELMTLSSLNVHIANHERLKEGDEGPSPKVKINEIPSDEKKIPKHFNNKTNIYICSLCSMEFTSRVKCKNHEFKHKNTFNKKCPKCNRQFTDSFKYDIHMKDPTKCDFKTFTCHVCGKLCASKTILSSHIATHGDFNCEICNLHFDMKSKLKSHMLVHATGNVVPCELCGKKFRSSNLYNHMRVHMGLKKFKCGICGARYIKEENLESHYNLKHFMDYPKKEPVRNVEDEELVIDLETTQNSVLQPVVEKEQKIENLVNPVDHSTNLQSYTQAFNYYASNNLSIPDWHRPN